VVTLRRPPTGRRGFLRGSQRAFGKPQPRLQREAFSGGSTNTFHAYFFVLLGEFH